MPVLWTFRSEEMVVVYTVRGALKIDELTSAVREFQQSSSFNPISGVMFDVTDVDLSDIEPGSLLQHTIQAARARKDTAHKEGIVIGGKGVNEFPAKLAAAYLNLAGGKVLVKIFTSKDECLQWLLRPWTEAELESIAPSPSSGR